MLKNGYTLLTTLIFSTITPSIYGQLLDPTTMQSHLQAGAALLGSFQPMDTRLANWMSEVDDLAGIHSLNIPGTHDTLTWAESGLRATFVKTQDISFFEQLDYGVRFVDLRIGLEDGGLRLFHGSKKLSKTAELEDIFWGLYHWLDNHPSETVLVSVKVDSGENTPAVQQRLRDLVTGEGVSEYWFQGNTFPSLGELRGKALLIRRLGFPDIQNTPPIGINLSFQFEDNSPAFTMDYLGTGNPLVYIEDLYNVDKVLTRDGIEVKYNALSAHLNLAQSPDLADQFFISFASGFSTLITPKDLAVDDGPGKPGVNSLAIDYILDNPGQRLGVIVYDYFGSDPRLGPVTIGQPDLVSEVPTVHRSANEGGSDEDSGARRSHLHYGLLSLPLVLVAALA